MHVEKSFYKQFFSLFIMLALQNAITLVVNLADNMMLGMYSEVSLSGVAAVNQIQFIFQQIMIALGDGLVAFCSQYWGKKQTGPMKKIGATVMWTGVGFGVFLFLAVSIFPTQTMSIFTTDAAIIEQGAEYIYIIRFSYFFFAVTQVLLAILRSVEIVNIAFELSILALFINCGINWVLIFGRFGFPELGVTGAAIGTLVARIVECGVLIIYIAKKEHILNLRLPDFFHPDKTLSKDYFKIALPLMVVQGVWGIGTAAQTVILGHMTATAIAANSVSNNVFMIVKSLSVGAGSAGAIITGTTIGTGDMDKVKHYAKVMQILFLLIGVAGGILLFFVRIPILSVYNLSAETKEMTNTFLLILCVIDVTMGYQQPTCNGIIKGGGNVQFPMRLNLISTCLIVIPLSCFMAFVVKASPAVVVWCLNSDQIFKCIPVFLEANFGNWIRKLTRD